MTSLTTIGPEHKHLEGRTVRDIVEYSPDHVNEVWCRKIFRQILQSLELQYAMHMPHRAITPDTVVFHDNGEPLLVPSDLIVPRQPGDASLDDMLRDDLTALAGIVHYAITRELAPSGPLRGRTPEGYSDSLVTAVDRCMSPDIAERPRTIEALRDILGIVALGPPVGSRPVPHPDALAPRASGSDALAASAASAAPASMPGVADPVPDATLSFLREPGRRRFGAGLGRWQRWAIAAGGGAVLAAIAVVIFAEMRDSGSYDDIALKLPQQSERGTAEQHPHASTPLALPPAPAEAPHAADVAAAPPGMAAATASGPAPAPATGSSGTTGRDALPPDLAAAMTTPAPAQAQAPQAGVVYGNAQAAGAAAPANGGPLAARTPAQALAANPKAMPARPGANATYKLQIQPWGTIYVDGVDRGVSPPVKRLVLAPGTHTVRVANPNYEDRVLEVDAARGDGRIVVDFTSETP